MLYNYKQAYAKWQTSKSQAIFTWTYATQIYTILYYFKN